MIIWNAVACKHCKTIIESLHRHDYVSCKCGAVSVDGGTDYLKRSYTHRDIYIELSIDSSFPYSVIRHFAYRRGYGKLGTPDYGKYRVTRFAQMTDEHLQASLDYHGVTRGGEHWMLLLREKLFRAEIPLFCDK